MRKFVAATAAAVISMTTLGVGSASAHAPSPRVGEQTAGIRWFGHRVHVNRHNPDQAIVTARYECEGVALHLWASVKQGPGVNRYVPSAERPSPPSDVARSWYDTPPNALPTCDGKRHTLRYTLNRRTEGSETHPGPWKRLKNGRAWAQFVVFSVPKGTDVTDPNLVPDREAFAGWVSVRRHHHHGHHR